jgi:predicted ABC-type ATPase
VNPILIVIAGPNGSGKTTVTAKLRGTEWSEGVEYINPDDVAREKFGDWNDPIAVRKAADWAGQRRDELVASGQSLAFETVFSTYDKVQFVHRAKSAGYFVRVFFVGTSDPNINAARVAARVAEGGHTVPLDKILSRYDRSLANLSAAIAIADRVYIYDNSIDDADARLCARTTEGQLRKIYSSLPEWVGDAVELIPHHSDFSDLRNA